MLRLIKDAFTEIYFFLMGLIGSTKLATYGSCLILALLQLLNLFSAILIVQHIVHVQFFRFFIAMRLAVSGVFILFAAIDFLIIYPARKTVEEEAGPLSLRSVVIPYGSISIIAFIACLIICRA